MAIFVDLQLDDGDDSDVSDNPNFNATETQPACPRPDNDDGDDHEDKETLSDPHHLEPSLSNSPPSPPRNLTYLAAAYPIISSIAANLDHNDLSSLANACKQMRENMLQYRKNLLGASLVCSTESKLANQSALQIMRRTMRCVRDLVARCGTCGEPTCRNCVYKPGRVTEEFRKKVACRVRRVCKKCQMAPEVIHQKPESNSNYKICICSRKMLWQCPRCLIDDAPLTTHKSFLTLLHHEKLQLIQDIHCTHFNPPSRPPNTRCVWVEACPSPTHSPLFQSATSTYTPHTQQNGAITCAMEFYAGGWAYQDISTGFIYRPPPSSCIGATSNWWSQLISDPNEGGFITYPCDNTWVFTVGSISCSDATRPRWARLVGKGLDARGVGRALLKFDQMHTMLEEEKEGAVRGWCTWCDGVALSKEDERALERL